MIVVDASVLVVALSDDDAPGAAARARLDGERVLVPHLVDMEVTAALRRLVRASVLEAGRAGTALDDLADADLLRADHTPLLGRIWALRDHLTAYDAAYVALAEAAGATLVTGDRRVAGAPGTRCRIEVLA